MGDGSSSPCLILGEIGFGLSILPIYSSQIDKDQPCEGSDLFRRPKTLLDCCNSPALGSSTENSLSNQEKSISPKTPSQRSSFRVEGQNNELLRLLKSKRQEVYGVTDKGQEFVALIQHGGHDLDKDRSHNFTQSFSLAQTLKENVT
jgi:hypothetical protein